MDIEHQVLQVSVDTGLGVNRGLLVRQKVVELDYSDRDRFKLLCLEHDLFEQGVLNDLVGDDRCEVPGLCDVPPIVAVKGSVAIVSQALNTNDYS